jgi:hypothetical protein
MNNETFPVLVRSDAGELIARINPDSTWSVKWSDVITQAYLPQTEVNIAVRAVCQLLLAGRDNFRTSSWSDIQAWDDLWFEIAPCAGLTQLNLALAIIDNNQVMLACVHSDGVWSVDWKMITERHASRLSVPVGAALAGFCELFMAAKDNFLTKPMME